MRKVTFIASLFALVCLAANAEDRDVLPGYNGRFKGNYKVDPTMLVDKTADELALMRNEIVAKYGREFTTPKYRDYFGKQSWYKVNPKYSDGMVTALDNENIKMILSFEKPSLDEKALRQTVMKRIEYSDDLYTVVFTDSQSLLIRTQSAGYYAENADEVYSWKVKGDWILCEKDLGNGYTQRILLLLDHRKGGILKMIVY
jgi:hypothetical protein